KSNSRYQKVAVTARKGLEVLCRVPVFAPRLRPFGIQQHFPIFVKGGKYYSAIFAKKLRRGARSPGKTENNEKNGNVANGSKTLESGGEAVV
ncbi:MAG: hypothetical protein II739_01975, partial [Clostridia bacterium]|nr:hypothetical protein [Clostridia bacterium]